MKDMQTLSRQRISLPRQRKLEFEVNVVVIEVEKNDKKIVATQKQMLRHNIELKADISIATKENYVAIIEVAESKISVATKKFYVATGNGREVR